MKIVVDIDEETFNKLPNAELGSNVVIDVLDAVEEGTPLPKKHGRLIDEDILRDKLRDSYLDSFGLMRVEKVLENIDATIEEDKEDE